LAVSKARLATTADIDEIVRLAELMYTTLGAVPPAVGEDRRYQWRRQAVGALRARLNADVVVFVCDHPEPGRTASPRLVACGAGSVSTRLPNLWHTDARVGYVQWMSTEEEFQRQGCGRRVLAALLDWFAAAGIDTVELHASSAGAPLYRSAGFWGGSTGLAMRRRSWDLPPSD